MLSRSLDHVDHCDLVRTKEKTIVVKMESTCEEALAHKGEHDDDQVCNYMFDWIYVLGMALFVPPHPGLWNPQQWGGRRRRPPHCCGVHENRWKSMNIYANL